MINFKQRDEVLPSALIVLSIVILAATLAYMLLVPPPTAAGMAKGREMSRQKIQDEIDRARARSAQIEKANRARLWQGNVDTVTSAALGKLTDLANRRSLKMTAFRPQRPQELEGVSEIPFSVQISGPYPAVRAMIAALDSSGAKLALRSVQMASSDPATSAVTATLGLSAYIASEPTTPPTRSTGGSRG